MTIALYECGHWIALVVPDTSQQLPQPSAEYIRRQGVAEWLAEDGPCANCQVEARGDGGRGREAKG